MAHGDKLVEKFKACHGQFPYRELIRMLKDLGFEEKVSGDGSVTKFYNAEIKRIISLHSPHPGNEVKAYIVRQVRELLVEEGLI